MKIITGDRCSGKSSYILEQCKKLKGKKLLIVPTMKEVRRIRFERDRSTNKNFKHTAIHSAFDVFSRNIPKDISWDYVLIDEIQACFHRALVSNLHFTCTENIYATLDKSFLRDIETVWPIRTCDRCICYPVCIYKQLTDNSRFCHYYHEKQEEITND